MIEYMSKIQGKATHLARRQRWEREIFQITAEIRKLQDISSRIPTSEADANIIAGAARRLDYMYSLQAKFDGYLQQIPVLGFNSSRYDLNLIKQKLLLALEIHDDKDHPFVIKKGNSYVVVSNQHYKFLDITQFIAAGHSYKSFLKAYDITEGKSFFPYEWFTDTEKLSYPELPPREAFYSSLKDEHLSEGDYEECKRVWVEQNMSTFKDWLIYYNCKDVAPFRDAVEKMQNHYFERGIDVFKETISLPGISRKLLFQYARANGCTFSLIDQFNRDLFLSMRNNCFGGPSILFSRHAEKQNSFIRGGNRAKK
jgi:hypothetical protein